MRLNSEVSPALASLQARRISHVFLVGCGGSLSIMVAGKYFLDRHCTTLASDVYNADEFVARDPRKLGPDALVILCSQTGTTKETVRAARHARKRGAATIGMTLDPTSPLAKAVDCAVEYQASYTTGIPIDAAHSNYGVLYTLLAGMLDQLENTRTGAAAAFQSGPPPARDRPGASAVCRFVRCVCASICAPGCDLHSGQRRGIRRRLFIFNLRLDGDAMVRFAGHPRQRIFPRPLRGRRQGSQLHRHDRSR